MQPSLLHDGANRSLTENTRLEGATSPQAENTAPQKCEAVFRSDVAYSVGVRLSAFFTDLDCELFHNARCDGPAPPEQAKTSALKLPCSVLRIRSSYLFRLMLSSYLYASFMVLGQLFA